MKVQIDKSYPMPCSPEVAWEFLQDLEAVAACMPGAKITERLDAGRYKGTVTVKVGPATMSFRGEVGKTDVDPAARSLRLLGKGTDSTGSSAVDGAHCAHRARRCRAVRLAGSSEASDERQGRGPGGRMMSTAPTRSSSSSPTTAARVARSRRGTPRFRAATLQWLHWQPCRRIQLTASHSRGRSSEPAAQALRHGPRESRGATHRVVACR